MCRCENVKIQITNYKLQITNMQMQIPMPVLPISDEGGCLLLPAWRDSDEVETNYRNVFVILRAFVPLAKNRNISKKQQITANNR